MLIKLIARASPRKHTSVLTANQESLLFQAHCVMSQQISYVKPPRRETIQSLSALTVLMFIHLSSSPATGHFLCPSAGSEKTLPKITPPAALHLPHRPGRGLRVLFFGSAYPPCHLQLFSHTLWKILCFPLNNCYFSCEGIAAPLQTDV